MVNIRVLISAILLIGVLRFTFAAVERRQDCMQLMMLFAKKQMKSLGECSREMKTKITDPKEYQEKIQCVIKCSMKNENMMDDNYEFTNASLQGFMDKNVPETLHELGHLIMDDCIAKFNGKFDVNDPLCATYGEFARCMQNTIGELC